MWSFIITCVLLFLLNLPIAIPELFKLRMANIPKINVAIGWLGKEYNKHVTMKSLISVQTGIKTSLITFIVIHGSGIPLSVGFYRVIFRDFVIPCGI